MIMQTEEYIKNAAWNYIDTEYPGVPFNSQLVDAFLAGAKFIIDNTQKG